jgi:hypothetical protein
MGGARFGLHQRRLPDRLIIQANCAPTPSNASPAHQQASTARWAINFSFQTRHLKIYIAHSFMR